MAKRKAVPVRHFQKERGVCLCGGSGRAILRWDKVNCPDCLRIGRESPPHHSTPHFNRRNEPVAFDRLPLVPVYSARDIYEYFTSSLGTPHDPGRLPELRGVANWPVESVCGELCADAIDAAVKLLRHMETAYGAHNEEGEAIRAATLHICEVYCFG